MSGATSGTARLRLGALLVALAAAPFAATATAQPAAAKEVVRRVGNVTIRADVSQAFPGGVVVVRLLSRGRLGAAWALLDGRRAPFYPVRGVPRALVPLPADAEPGEATLGIGIAARGGQQRIAIKVEVAAREYRSRYVYLSEEQRALVAGEEGRRDGRRLLALVRSESKLKVPGLLIPPVSAVGSGYGEPRTHTGAPEVESRFDALSGERHRGIDYRLTMETPVRAPAAGTVLFAGPMALPGGTVVIDHGQGVVSVLHHLASVAVREGEEVAAAALVGLSGQSGLAPEPMLQWRVYLHGVAVDPLVLGALL